MVDSVVGWLASAPRLALALGVLLLPGGLVLLPLLLAQRRLRLGVPNHAG